MAQTGNHKGLAFGIFLAPFHRVGENPTLAMARDMELVEWIDELGFDEAWIGEHHSAGWETIASPEVFIGAALERTRYIRLGSGVTSLPYHHPLMVANRFVQLDHMSRGRTMLGCGPGALPSDAYMMGIEPSTQRARMDQALDAIMRLLKCEEPVTMKTDWFELKEARLHLAPYTYPHFPIACASTITPSGMIAAGKHGVGVLSIGAGIPGGPEMLGKQWQIYEETAAKHGKTADRGKWRVVVNAHIAEDDEQALVEVHAGERRETVTYFEDTLGRPPGRADDPLREGVAMGTTLVGSPDTVAKGINRLLDLSAGGFGGVLFRAHEWASRESTMRSYELFARYVMPRFQGSLDTIVASNEWARSNRRGIFGPNVEAVKKAFTDAGRAVPEEFRARTPGARDVGDD
jgi:limonene 1,2-monooxygenase